LPITLYYTAGEILGDILYSLKYKYLGVDIFIRNKMCIFKLKHTAMIHRAKSMSRIIKGMAARSVDVAWVAEELWHKVAIPTILYASEITEISPKVMETIEGFHAQMAAFKLGVSGNCSHAGILCEARWKSASCIMFKRKLKYFWRFYNMDDTRLAKAAFNDSFSHLGNLSLPWKVSYKDEINKIMKMCNIPEINKDTKWKSIIPCVDKWDTDSIDNRITSKVQHSLKWLPMKFVNNGEQSYIDGTPESKAICQFRLGNAKLKNREGMVIRKCPHCHENATLTEAHMVMTCKALEGLRHECGINKWCVENKMESSNEDEKLRLYLGDDGAVGYAILDRGKTLIKMRDEFFNNEKRLFDIQEK
jgi:hypothetical protein